MPEVVDDALAIEAPARLHQFGVPYPEAAGMNVVMDRCISVEHRRLLGR